MKNRALVVIDLQNDITKNYKDIIAKVNEAVDWAEQKELLTPDDIQRDIIDKAGADMKAFEHVNYCLAVRKA